MIPHATYRLQLQPQFTFDDATEVVGYLADLGISHAYCSPYLQAAPGSTHGYDVVDHSQVNRELGGAEAHARFSAALRAHGMGQIVDLVPNHMSIATHENRWWWDVLQSGPASRYADYFDVDWHPPEEKLGNKVLLPILGDHYGRVIETDAVKLVRHDGEVWVHVYDRVLPTDPASLSEPLRTAAGRCNSDDLAFIADAYLRLPVPSSADIVQQYQRSRDIAVLSRQMKRLCAEAPEVASAIDTVLSEISGDSTGLDIVLERQNYRLAFWRTARHDLDYRRFFDINELAALRMMSERVFRDTHQLVLEWLRDELVDGLRIDHPDGLGDPEAYFQRLRDESPEAWIVAEKVLEPGETLPETWPIHGTTGYDFLYRLNGLFVDTNAEEAMTRIYTEFVGADEPIDFVELVRAKKEQILVETLVSDVNRLAAVFKGVCERHRHYRDYTRDELRHVLQTVVICFPVYRTYIKSGQPITDRDRDVLHDAFEQARERRDDLDPELFGFLHQILLCEWSGELEAELIRRFQQLTGPVMAKGLEDTAFYGYHRLVALNEVGGNPDVFGVSLGEFHDYCRHIQEKWPHTMTATSTHDTKRSEDVRVRIALLSEIPETWEHTVRRWKAHNEKYRTGEWPDRGTEYLVYQTLVGAWPISADRLAGHIEKAIREAKLHTSWTRQHTEYETAVQSFINAICTDDEFLHSVESFVAPLIGPGRVQSLSQVLVKLMAPGVPDIFQGNEIWELRLTDPDNRQPVDYLARRRLLRDARDSSVDEIMARMDEGMPKIFLTHAALRVREKWPEAFGADSEYRPIFATGPHARRVVAFSRNAKLVVVAPRLLLGFDGEWGDTAIALPDGPWRNVLTAETISGGDMPIGPLLRRFPVALLVRDESRPSADSFVG